MSFLPDIAYAVSFSRIVQFDAVRMKALRERFESLENAWRASGAAFLSLGFRQSFVDRFLALRDGIHPEREYERMLAEHVAVIFYDDPSYPFLLSKSSKPPALLYYRGEIPGEDDGSIVFAVVGTRKATQYGMRAIEVIIPPLVDERFVIVSGLAYGIDTHVHNATIENGGITCAVLGSGVDDKSIYPSENHRLVQKMIEQGGCLMSEYPVGTRPQKEHFPLRNRIVAGMSHGVLVIEAPERSGALITAYLALEQNREVFAIPAPITAQNSKGTNSLLKLGAHVVTEARDILRVFGLDEPDIKITQKKLELFNETEKNIYTLLSSEPMHVDEMCTRLCLDIQTVNSTLGVMELNGFIKNVGHVRYVRS